MKNCKNIRLMFIKGPLVILTITKGLLPKTILSKKTISRFLSQKKVVEKVLFSFIFWIPKHLPFYFITSPLRTQSRIYQYLYTNSRVTLFESRKASETKFERSYVIWKQKSIRKLIRSRKTNPENEYVPEPPSFRPRSNQWSYPSPAWWSRHRLV